MTDKGLNVFCSAVGPRQRQVGGDGPSICNTNISPDFMPIGQGTQTSRAAVQPGFPNYPLGDFRLHSHFPRWMFFCLGQNSQPDGTDCLTPLPQEDGRNDEEDPTHLERTAHFGFWQPPLTALTTQRCRLLVRHCAASPPSSGGSGASIWKRLHKNQEWKKKKIIREVFL